MTTPREKASFFPHGTTVERATERPQGEGTHGVGERRRKVDGLGKATGRTLYADDIQMPGMLHAKIKRSTRPHARIVSIDTSGATQLPGVLAVVTGADFEGRYGVIPWTRDEEVLCKDKVRYVGDGVAAVAALDEETANAAVRAIRVEYEDLDAVLDTDAASRSGDDERSKVNELAKRGNITKAVDLAFGDVDGNLARATHVVDSDFYFQGTTHAPIEPHCAIGQWDGRTLTVTSATQVPHYLHRDLADILQLPESRIRVIQPPVGGAFGGKSEPFDLEFVVAKLAMLTHRPVKLLYTREEVFLAHRGRHPMRMRFTTGCDDQGKLLATRSQIDIDGGAYASFGMITAYYAGQLLAGPVGMQSYAFSATRYYTNKPACGPKRGHGSVQPRFAFEIQLDELAEKSGLDPFEIRRRNFVGEGQRTINGQQLGSSGLLECLEAVHAASCWDERRAQRRRGRGLGLATSMYISGTNYPIYPNDMPQSGVQVKVDRSGRVTLFCGASDIGQGSDSVLAYLAMEELGVELEDVQVVSSDTDLTPVDLGAYSSRVTLMMGHACVDALRKVREQAQDAVATFWNQDEKARAKTGGSCEREQVLLGHGKVWCALDTSLELSTREAFRLAEAHFGTLGATGGYRTQPRGGDYRGGTIGASPAYSCTAHVADVEVDEATGRIHVHKIWVAHDCGRALNPMLVEGQMEGSTYMGMAEVAMEHMLYGDDAFHGGRNVRAGMLVGPSLLDYRIPTALDTPAIEALIVEKPDPNGPYGAKEAGEGPLHSTIPAVAHAIYDAVGIRLRE
ncbi:MAG: xanthine dehydrogenase family protein molybdopterin-binding subunit, partial [Myxococcota bacterium]